MNAQRMLLLVGVVSLVVASPAVIADGPCPLIAEGEGEGEGEPAGALTVPLIGRVLRHLLALLAALWIAGMAIPATRRYVDSKAATVGLALLALMSVGTYSLFERSTPGRFVNNWELFHYYLGSKYLAELGHDGLYAAVIVADDQTGLRYDGAGLRNLVTAGCIPTEEVLLGCQTGTYDFTPARWDAFVGDVQHFKNGLSDRQWNTIFHDKGYNATPIWSMTASALTSRVPTSSSLGMFGLTLLDPLLLLGAVVAVWRTFGARTALLMVVLIGTHMTMSHQHMKGAFLRTDWVAALVMAVCAVKAKRPALGGALVAFAALLRVFPLLFAGGLLAALLFGILRRSVGREPIRFALGFVLGIAGLVGLSIVANPAGTWSAFAVKIWQHHDSFSPWRVGFKNLILGAYEYRADGTHQAAFQSMQALWWSVQAVMLGGFLYLSRRLEGWEKLAFGFIPVFFLTTPTYYYFIMLVIPLLFFCGRMARVECAVGAAWLFGSSSLAYLVQDAVGRELPLFYLLSWIVLSICALMAYSAWREGGSYGEALSAPNLS